MGRKPRKEAPFGVLDALSIAHLPDDHLVAAVASYLLANGYGLPDAVEAAHHAASLLARTEEQVQTLADRITGEIQRQVVIKCERIRHHLWNRKQGLMGAQLDWGTRINRLSRSVFGPPEIWRPAKKIAPRIRDPHYNWFHRCESVRVSGFEGYSPDDDGLITGFVYRERGPTKYCLLPSKARSLQELLTFLGLHPRLLGSGVKVDWDRQAFLVGTTNRLPWVVP